MKKYILEFIRRGLAACGFGPVVLAILYLILERQGLLETLTVSQVALGIFSLSALAFIAGGMNAIYQVEELPLMIAILIHGCILYVAYLAVYLMNGWIDLGIAPLLVFTSIFIIGYLIIWAIIYAIVKNKTKEINRILEEKRKHVENI
jgi:hypothetical protein